MSAHEWGPDGASGNGAGTQTRYERSAVGELVAEQAHVERSLVRSLHTKQAAIDRSAVGWATFDQGTMKQSTAGVVAGRSVACDQVQTLVLAAPVVRGEVHTWFDLRTAVAVGVGIVLGKAIIAALKTAWRRALG